LPLISRSFAVCAAFGFAVLTGHVGLHAQSEFGAPIPPELCRVEPLTEAELIDAVSAATPVAVATETSTETGSTLNDAEREPIIAVVSESIACSNANDPMRAYALFTDRYLRIRFNGENADDLGHLLVAITREPEPAAEADQLSIVSMDDFRRLDDGRVSVVVTTSNADATFTDLIYLTEFDGRWLIDEAVPADSPAPTPRDT
jgi:hypothetical protein